VECRIRGNCPQVSAGKPKGAIDLYEVHLQICRLCVLFLTSFVLSACSGPVGSSSGSVRFGGGPFTISVTVSGLRARLVLADNTR